MRLSTISLVGFFVFAVSAAVSAQSSIPWIRNVDQARQLAQQDQRLLLLHFYADWCSPCKTLDRTVFPHPDVGRSISANYVPVKIDLDRNEALAKQYGITTIPADVITDAQGRVLFQTNSPSDPSQYSQLLNRLASSRRLTTPVHTVAARMPQQEAPDAGTAKGGWGNTWQGQAAGYDSAGPPQTPDSRYDARSAWQAGSYGTETSGFYSGSRQQDARSQYGGGLAGQSPAGPPAATSSFSNPTSDRMPSNMAVGAQENRSAQWPTAEAEPPQGPGFGPNNAQASWGQTNPTANAAPAAANAVTPPAWNQPSGLGGQAAMPQSAPGPGTGFANPYVTPPAGATAMPAGNSTAGPASATVPPLALDGYCTVTLADGEKWEQGNRMWGARHRGRTYLFVSQQQKQKFLADPDRYSPVLSGYDPTRYVDYGEPIPGQRRHGMWFRGKTYLFADEDSLKRFSLNPEYYAQKAHEIMMAGGR